MTFCNHCWISSGILPDISTSISEIVFSQLESEEHSAQNVVGSYLYTCFCLMKRLSFLLETGGNLSKIDTFPPVSNELSLKHFSIFVGFNLKHLGIFVGFWPKHFGNSSKMLIFAVKISK